MVQVLYCSRRPSAYSCTRIVALTGAHKHTRRQRRRRRRSTVFTRRVSFGKASHQGLEIWAEGFPALVRMGSWEERECSNSKEGSRHNCLKVTLEKWPKAMQWHHWICDDVSVRLCDGNWLGHWSDSGRKLELVLLNLLWCIRDNWLGHWSDSGRKLELVFLNLWWCIRLKSVMNTDWGTGQILAGNQNTSSLLPR